MTNIISTGWSHIFYYEAGKIIICARQWVMIG